MTSLATTQPTVPTAARRLLEASLDPLAAISADGKLTDVNEAMVQATGIARDSLVGSDFADYFTDPKRAIAAYRQALEAGSIRDYPLVLRHVSGTLMELSYNVSAYRNDEGGVAGVFAAARDITAQKRAEDELRRDREDLEERMRERAEALQKSEERFRIIVSNTPDHLIVQDRELRYTLVVNPQLGLTEDDMIGNTDQDILQPEEADHLTSLKRRVLETGKPVNVEASLTSATGEEQFFDGSYVAKIGAHGDIDGVIGYFRNVTERKRLEAHIRRLNVELHARAASLEVANQELESFGYSVSHELRAPLQAINGFAQVLKADHGDKIGEQGRHLIDVIRANTVHMAQLIDDLLQLAHIGRRELAAQPLDMQALVRGVAEELTAAEKQRSIEITLSPLQPAFGDSAMLKQVWMNLLANAIKFSSRRAAARIEVGSRMDDGQVVYWVKDNGAGFDMQHAGKLFRVFERLHRQDQFEGTGVGLAIAQRIVLRHGGRIWAEGQPDAGATFYFSLPAADNRSGLPHMPYEI